MSQLWLALGGSDMIQEGGKVLAREVDKGMRQSKENGRRMKNSHVQRMEDRAPQGYGAGAKCFREGGAFGRNSCLLHEQSRCLPD